MQNSFPAVLNTLLTEMQLAIFVGIWIAIWVIYLAPMATLLKTKGKKGEVIIKELPYERRILDWFDYLWKPTFLWDLLPEENVRLVVNQYAPAALGIAVYIHLKQYFKLIVKITITFGGLVLAFNLIKANGTDPIVPYWTIPICANIFMLTLVPVYLLEKWKLQYKRVICTTFMIFVVSAKPTFIFGIIPVQGHQPWVSGGYIRRIQEFTAKNQKGKKKRNLASDDDDQSSADDSLIEWFISRLAMIIQLGYLSLPSNMIGAGDDFDLVAFAANIMRIIIKLAQETELFSSVEFEFRKKWSALLMGEPGDDWFRIDAQDKADAYKNRWLEWRASQQITLAGETQRVIDLFEPGLTADDFDLATAQLLPPQVVVEEQPRATSVAIVATAAVRPKTSRPSALTNFTWNSLPWGLQVDTEQPTGSRWEELWEVTPFKDLLQKAGTYDRELRGLYLDYGILPATVTAAFENHEVTFAQVKAAVEQRLQKLERVQENPTAPQLVVQPQITETHPEDYPPDFQVRFDHPKMRNGFGVEWDEIGQNRRITLQRQYGWNVKKARELHQQTGLTPASLYFLAVQQGKSEAEINDLAKRGPDGGFPEEPNVCDLLT